jgi:hypothetical protein
MSIPVWLSRLAFGYPRSHEARPDKTLRRPSAARARQFSIEESNLARMDVAWLRNHRRRSFPNI